MPERNLNIISVHSVLADLNEDIKYTPELFGLPPINSDGANVKICIIDSGLPDNLSIGKIKESVNFSKSESIVDEAGHASLVSGIIGGTGHLSGLAADAELYYAKVSDTRIRIDSCVAAILWCCIKEIDLIVIPLTCTIDNENLHDAIKKAYQHNICILAPAGNHTLPEYPALYPEVLSIGALGEDGKVAIYSAKGDFNIKGTKITSTYTEQRFAVVSGTSVATSVAAGICAKVIGQHKENQIEYDPQVIYDYMKSISV